MNFLDAAQDALGIDIPEYDWAGFVTLDDLRAYLATRTAAEPGSPRA